VEELMSLSLYRQEMSTRIVDGKLQDLVHRERPYDPIAAEYGNRFCIARIFSTAD
jgi:hypothetical protein